jgi:hypothetical protein
VHYLMRGTIAAIAMKATGGSEGRPDVDYRGGWSGSCKGDGATLASALHFVVIVLENGVKLNCRCKSVCSLLRD